MLLPSNKIYISKSNTPNAGRGVFSYEEINKGDTIEICPVIELFSKDVTFLKRTTLKNYYFLWGMNHDTLAICLGFGSLYNHSYSPNATYKKNIKQNLITFVAIKDIKKNEEIAVNYNYGDPNDKSPLWIKTIKPYN